MCICEIFLEKIEEIREKLTSLEYKNLIELIAVLHKDCERREIMNYPQLAGYDRDHSDMILRWATIRDRGLLWAQYAEENLRHLEEDIFENRVHRAEPTEIVSTTDFSSLLALWKERSTTT
jgi:hypothetical protein